MLPQADSAVFVILPAYNEHQAVGSVIQALTALPYPIVFVDDGSEPPLFSGGALPPIHYLRHAVNLGQGAALQTGIEFAIEQGAQYIVTFDADGQHDVHDIEKLLAALLTSEADIVLGSRFMQSSAQNVPAGRKVVLQAARYVNFLFTGLLLTDAHNGLRAMNRKAAEKIQISENRMSHATEILAQVRAQRLRYKEIPVNVYYTHYSRSKGQTVWQSFRILFDLLLNKVFK